MRFSRKQIPNTKFKFTCGCTHLLPVFGESSDTCIWKNKRSWICRKHTNEIAKKRERLIRAGKGPSGILGRMRLLLRKIKIHSELRGYASPNVTAEELVTAWEQQEGKCKWTGMPISFKNAAIGHNHQTGEFQGFLIREANWAEGYLLKLPSKTRLRFIQNAFPEILEKYHG